jgi:hypothetical protein
VCHPGSKPNPGGLVVVPPDDSTRADELNSYANQLMGTGSLFSYHPGPSILRWLRPYVNRLHVVLPVFLHDQLPDSWLNASVTV